MGEALARRKLSQRITRQLVDFFVAVPRFRRPAVSVEDFYRYGVGNKGVFLSRSKATGEYDSVALLSEPATDKNVYYMSSFAWAIDIFRESVAPDFSIQDGITLCASIACIPNAEVIVNSLVSGELKRVWSTRHSANVGAIGLLFDIARRRNGGVSNVGTGCTRRTQPWIGWTVPAERYKKLVEYTMDLCTRSHRSKTEADCTQEQYEVVLAGLHSAIGSRQDRPLLCLQHFLHLIHKLGYLLLPGMHRLAAVNPDNSNLVYMEEVLGGTQSKSERKKKLLQMQMQTEVYFSTIFQTDFGSGMGENAICEAFRHFKEEESNRVKIEGGKYRKQPIPATDMFFPGQRFFEHRKCTSTKRFVLTKVGLVWNDSINDFQSIAVQNYGKLGPHTTVNSLDAQPPLMDRGSLDCGSGEGRNQVFLVPRQDINGALFLKIKQLMVSSERGSAAQELHRISNAIGTLLKPILQMTRSPTRRPAKLLEWEVRAEAWNSYIEPRLAGALSYHRQQESSLPCPTRSACTTSTTEKAAKEKKKKGKKKPPPTLTKPSQPSTTLPPPKATIITVTPEALHPTEDNWDGNYEDMDMEPLSLLFEEEELGKDPLLEINSCIHDPLQLIRDPVLETDPDSRHGTKRKWQTGLPKESRGNKKHRLGQGSANSLRATFRRISDSVTRMRCRKTDVLRREGSTTSSPIMVDLTEDDSNSDSDNSDNEIQAAPNQNHQSLSISNEHQLALPPMSLLHQLPPPPMPPMTTPPQAGPQRTRIRVDTHPVLEDIDGWNRVLDWSKENLRRSSSQSARVNNVVIHSYKDPGRLSYVVESRFRGYIGSKSIFEPKESPLFKCPNLLDEARTCLNSCLLESGTPPVPKDFGKRDFAYDEYLKGSSKFFACRMPRILGDFTFHTCNRCLLCDQLADLLLAERVPHLGAEIWAFQTPELALHYTLLCLFLTAGTSSYFLGLQRRARKKYNGLVVAAREVGTKPKKTEELDGGDYFLLAFGCKEITEMPYFYLVCNHRHKRLSHHLCQPAVSHDFAIAVGDLAYHRRCSTPEGRRKLGKAPGKAVYFRPLRMLEQPS